MIPPALNYRDKANRLEGFDRFYQFHVATNDCESDVAVETWIAEDQHWDFELRCTLALFYGATYAPCNALFAVKFPVFRPDKISEMIDFFETNNKRLAFSGDCKYRKLVFPKFLTSIAEAIKPHRTLGNFIRYHIQAGTSPTTRYRLLQQACMDNWYCWGRMGHWCFAEALDRFAIPLDPPTMEFGQNGKSHTEGWAFCIGRDDLVERIEAGKSLTNAEVAMLEDSARDYLQEFRVRHPDLQLATNFTLETACCVFKRQHKASRYCGCYVDLQYDEVVHLRSQWPEYGWLWDKFMEARQVVYPRSLLYENFESGGHAYMSDWCRSFRDYGRIPRVEAWFNNEPQSWKPLEHQPWYGPLANF